MLLLEFHAVEHDKLLHCSYKRTIQYWYFLLVFSNCHGVTSHKVVSCILFVLMGLAEIALGCSTLLQPLVQARINGHTGATT